MLNSKALTIVYHDIVKPGEFDSSGFPGRLAAHYKIDRQEFEKHLSAIYNVIGDSGVDTTDSIIHDSMRRFLTFDDGGASAYHFVADRLESFGWRGHFFVTSNYIATPGFLTGSQIRELRRRGHVIGSHSASHPERISDCTWDQLIDEWRTSSGRLADILGEPITAAAVPGGFYSRKVARAAAAAGIRTLFTSEPTTVPHLVHNCTILGRYVVLRGMSPGISAALAAGDTWQRRRQTLTWNLKKPLKSFNMYAWLRRRLLDSTFSR